MQKVEETTSMPSHNPNQETLVPFLPFEPKKTTHIPELEKPFSSETASVYDLKESKKSKSKESTYQSHDETVAAACGDSPVRNTIWEEEKKCTNVQIKSEGTVEDSSSGRERLKRHRVEVAGRVWIPDMWGQENLLKDWIDCAAFDSPLVNSSIMAARASLVEEGRRANSTRLRIENSC